MSAPDYADLRPSDAEVLAVMRILAPVVEERRNYGLKIEDAEVYARAILASDWHAIIAAEREALIRERDEWQKAAFSLTRQRDEARAKVEAVEALLGDWAIYPDEEASLGWIVDTLVSSADLTEPTPSA